MSANTETRIQVTMSFGQRDTLNLLKKKQGRTTIGYVKYLIQIEAEKEGLKWEQ